MKTVYLLGVIAGITLTGCARSSDSARQKKPNIIFLMADDQCTYSMGCYGNKDVKTPQMDKLASEGIIFDNYYNTTAICMASRATVMTGKYEFRHGTNFEHGDMHQDTWANSYPNLLREVGYFTAFAGKFGFHVEGKGICGSDYDMYGGSDGQTSYETRKNKSMIRYADRFPHSTLSYGAFGQDVIREAVKQNRPFCLSISFKAPHRPVQPDPAFDHIYHGKDFTKPANFGREYSDHLSPQGKTGRQWNRFIDWGYDSEYEKVMAKYNQQVYAIDVAIGMIREELIRQGAEDNTVIIYTSDNGFICGSHGYASKVLPLEESSRAPLIIHDPRSRLAGKNKRCDALTGNIDIAPTILSLAGLPVNGNMDGVNLLPLVDGKKRDVRTSMAFMNTWGPITCTSLTVILRDWKYTYWWYKDATMEPFEEFFDTKNDPLELENLALDPEAGNTLEKMRTRYDKEVSEWKKKAVSYNDYERFGILFDRSVPWPDKVQWLNGSF